MFEKAKFENPEEIKEPSETTKKVELSPEHNAGGVIPTKKEFEKERKEKLDDLSRYRDFR